MQKRVLVVDDNEESRLLITICLKEHAEIFQADSGLKGLKILEQTNVDLIVSDINMPEMTGVDFIRELANRNFKIPIIVVSAERPDEVRGKLKDFSIVGFFQKPFVRDQLREAAIVYLM